MKKKVINRKYKKIWIGILLLLLAILIGILLYFALNYQNTSSERLEDQSSTQIEAFHSSIDYDQDGIDDQTDMLQGALAYIETKPKYKSKYYVGGYPDDQYGVCTDVVANACLAAGYDLRQLVNQDIVDHPDEYDVEEPDSNIDFRRVKNLKVYFKRNAVELTTDIQRIEEWQGGDIVIFKSHIGIVSDRRNERGIPYVIHHNDPRQKQYEEDILETRNDIVGHYRISE